MQCMSLICNTRPRMDTQSENAARANSKALPRCCCTQCTHTYEYVLKLHHVFGNRKYIFTKLVMVMIGRKFVKNIKSSFYAV